MNKLSLIIAIGIALAQCSEQGQTEFHCLTSISTFSSDLRSYGNINLNYPDVALPDSNFQFINFHDTFVYKDYGKKDALNEIDYMLHNIVFSAYSLDTVSNSSRCLHTFPAIPSPNTQNIIDSFVICPEKNCCFKFDSIQISLMTLKLLHHTIPTGYDKQTARRLWNILHHAPPEILARGFIYIQSFYRLNLIPSTYYYTTVDRLLAYYGMPQVMGSQFQNSTMLPVLYPAKLDSLRLVHGFSDLSTYKSNLGVIDK